MTDEQILEIFYTKMIPEVQKGKIDCYFRVNMAFDLIIGNQEISKCSELSDDYDGVLIPTLKITDKQLFDDALIEYVKRALEFYSPLDFSFLNDLDMMGIKDLDTVKREYLVKYVISTLFANASFSDFDNPIKFLRSRIAMFDNKILDDEGKVELGYIDSIGARIYVEEEISPIKSETPYRMKSYLQFDDGYKLLLPEIYAGSDGDKYQLYGIQKTTKSGDVDERPYLKQIRRGMIAKINGAPEHYFLAVMLFLSLCSDKEIEIIPFLVERWNAKRMAMYYKAQKNENVSFSDMEEEQDKIQNNITDIFIRYFTKLEDVSCGIDFHSVPFEADVNLHVHVHPDFESRSVLFNELFKLVNEYKYQKKSSR